MGAKGSMSEEFAYREILVPTDGSETVDASTRHAIRIGRNENARIHALFVVDRRVTMSASPDTRAELVESLETEGEQAVDDVIERATAAGLDARGEIRDGTPSKEIREYAGEHEIDLIVIGNSGKSPREKVMTMGSVSERVVEDASQPVLVVKADPEAAGSGPDP